jgi:hypothetical protein
MKLLGALRTQEHYDRLREMLPYPLLEWSEHLESAAELRECLAEGRHDLFILDPGLWWSQEAGELASRHGVETVLFHGDIREVGNLIVRRIAPLLEAREETIEPIKPLTPEGEGRGPVRIIEKEKIVEVEKVIEKERIVERQVKVAVPVHSYVSMQSRLCLILNLTPRAGATFLATTLATAVAARQLHCTLFEHPTNRIALYDHLNVAEHLPEYRPALETYDTGALKKDSEFLYQGIAMYLNHPGYPYQETDPEEITKLLYQLRHSPYIFYDASYHGESLVPELLAEFDDIFVVVEPDPVLLQRLMQPDAGPSSEEYQLLQELLGMEEAGHFSLHLVVNKNNAGVDQKLLQECLPKKPLAILPMQSAKAVSQAAWEARLIEIDDELEDQLMPILKRIVPENFLQPADDEAKSGGWLGKLFAKK